MSATGTLNPEKVRAALKRAARVAISGDRESRSGRFLAGDGTGGAIAQSAPKIANDKNKNDEKPRKVHSSE